MKPPPSLCREPTDSLQFAYAVRDLTAELESLSCGFDILQQEMSTRRQNFLLGALTEKLAAILTSVEEIARRADDITNAGGRL
jgi:hypothetical protein